MSPFPGRSLPRRRIASLLVVLALLASGQAVAPWTPEPVQAQEADPEPVPASPPTPLPDSAREPVPADAEQPGIPESGEAPPMPAGRGEDKVKDKREVPEKASENGSVYEVNGGEHLLALSTGRQNFKDTDGKWKKIDSGLVKDKGGYRSAQGPVGVFFPDTLSETSRVRFELPDGTLGFYPVGASDKAKAKQDKANGVVYEDVLEATDLRYFSIASGYKEEIVLAEPPAGDRLSWEVTATGLSLHLEETGQVSILAGEEVVGTIPAPTVSDSAIDPATGHGTETDTFAYELTEASAGEY